MQGELLEALLGTIDSKIFTLVLQLIVVGAVFMWIKDMNTRVVNYLKLKMSEFGRGTKIKIDGFEGHLRHIGFNEVEITLSEDETLLIPVESFIKAKKVIVVQGPVRRTK
jgi:hypothetical protein